MNGSYQEAEKVIEEVLSRSEFNRSKERQINLDWLKKILDKIQEFFSKILKAINEWLEKLLGRLNLNFGGGGGDATAAKTIAKIIIITLIVAAIIAIIIVFIKILRRGKIRKMISEEDRELAEYSHDPDAALALAEKSRAEGQTRLSFRYLFINLLTELNKREIIKIARYKTNRSYMKETLGSGREGTEKVKPFFDTFNRVWYGGKKIGMTELDNFFRERTTILGLIDGRTGKSGDRDNG